MLKNKSMKRADSTIEIALAIVMAVVALYFVLNLFSGNIQTIVKNSGIYRALYKNNTDAKTAYVKDPNPIKTQINVQIVGDQGSLAFYHNTAIVDIDNYSNDRLTGPLSDEQLENLALALTVYAESGVGPQGSRSYLLAQGSGDTYFKGGSSYLQFAHDNGIYLDITGYLHTTKVTFSNGITRPFEWGKNKNYVARYDNTCSSPSEEPLRIKNIQAIKDTFN